MVFHNERNKKEQSLLQGIVMHFHIAIGHARDVVADGTMLSILFDAAEIVVAEKFRMMEIMLKKKFNFMTCFLMRGSNSRVVF